MWPESLPRPSAHLAPACVALALALGGCSDGEPSSPAAEQDERPERRRTSVEPSRCPAAQSNCKTASGRVIYVEAVDPDGDGDAHFVLRSRESITAPGVSVIDVKVSLRPDPLPGIGDLVSAAGPVYRGSYGQKQIEAIDLQVGRH